MTLVIAGAMFAAFVWKPLWATWRYLTTSKPDKKEAYKLRLMEWWAALPKVFF